MVIEAKGRAGASATFDGQYLTLRRKGLTAVGKGERRVHVSQITAVEWKPAGAIVEGFIRFVIPGTVARRSAFGTQSRDARTDEWAVPFNRKGESQFEHLRSAVERAVAGSQGGRPQSPQSDVLDQLQRLGHLRSSGVLTEAEFQAKKQQLLRG